MSRVALQKAGWRNSTRPLKLGVTLIEILVVVSVVALLAAMLLPAIQRVRESARAISCRNNLRQVGLALHSYDGSFRQLPPNVVTPWTFAVLPQLELKNLFEKYDHRYGPFGDSTNNAELGRVRVSTFECPMDPPNSTGPWEWSSSSYAANVKLISDNAENLGRCRDGLSNTGLALEISTEYGFAVISGPVTPLGIGTSRHHNVFHLLLADGAVRSIDNSVSLEIMIAIGTPNGGEVLQEF